MAKFKWNTPAFVVGLVYAVISEFGTTVMTSMGNWAVIFKPVEWTNTLLANTIIPVAQANFIPLANLALWGAIAVLIYNMIQR